MEEELRKAERREKGRKQGEMHMLYRDKEKE